jgi:hypothetical protein
MINLALCGRDLQLQYSKVFNIILENREDSVLFNMINFDPSYKKNQTFSFTSNCCPHTRHTFIKWKVCIKPHFHKQACLQAGYFLGGRKKTFVNVHLNTNERWSPGTTQSMGGDPAVHGLFGVCTYIQFGLTNFSDIRDQHLIVPQHVAAISIHHTYIW